MTTVTSSSFSLLPSWLFRALYRNEVHMAGWNPIWFLYLQPFSQSCLDLVVRQAPSACCASLMKLKFWLVISPVLLWFFSRELILSLKATFSHEAAQGTPAKLIILLRAVYTPLRLGVNQCRHPCKWTSRSSQLFLGSALCFPLHVSVKPILLGKGTSRP